MNAQIFDALSKGNAFTNPLPALSSASQGLISSGKATTNSLTNVSDPQIKAALTAGGLTSSVLTSSGTMFDSASTGLATLGAYGGQCIAEAYSRMGTSVSYKSGLKTVGREPNNCDIINNAFGIIQTTGRQWIAAMQNALNTVVAKMNELSELVAQGVSAGLAKIQELAATVTGYINAAITQINAVITDITNGIAAELKYIQDMITECLNFSFANVLSEWFKDSCAKGVINAIGSNDLKSSLEKDAKPDSTV